MNIHIEDLNAPSDCDDCVLFQIKKFREDSFVNEYYDDNNDDEEEEVQEDDEEENDDDEEDDDEISSYAANTETIESDKPRLLPPATPGGLHTQLLESKLLIVVRFPFFLHYFYYEISTFYKYLTVVDTIPCVSLASGQGAQDFQRPLSDHEATKSLQT